MHEGAANVRERRDEDDLFGFQSGFESQNTGRYSDRMGDESVDGADLFCYCQDRFGPLNDIDVSS